MSDNNWKQNLTQEQKTQRALDYQEIQNTASKHEYYHKGCKHRDELKNVWSQKQPDVSWQNNSDRWIGMDVLIKFYAEGLEASMQRNLEWMAEEDPTIEVKPENLGMGYLCVHMMTTPIIEIAGDGQTAKGIWMSIGDITQPMGGKIRPQWAQDMYAIDFIKEDGEWKIWHLTTCVDFYTTFDTSWLDNAANFFMEREHDEREQMDAHMPSENPGNYYNAYSRKTVAQFLPRIPEPYWTFSDTFSY